MSENNVLTMIAMEDYESPALPRLNEAKPNLLKKIPSRWKNKSLITAIGLGILGTMPLSGCEYGFHLGGAGPAPIYVAHLTELDAIGMIRTQLEEAGLNITSEVPSYYIERWGGNRWENEIGIDFFDEERNVAIVFINQHDGLLTSSIDDGEDSHGRWMTSGIQEDFERAHHDLIVGVFYNPSQRRHWRGRNQENPHTDEELEWLTDRLEEQVQAFIERLQRRGIIE